MPLRATSPTTPLLQVLTQEGTARIHGTVLKVLWNERTMEKVRWIQDNHRPAPLPKDVLGELRRIVRRAETGSKP